MSNWYCGRAALKRAVGIDGADRNSVIDALIEAASREIDGLTNRRFIPKTATRSYNWPQRDGRSVYTIYLDEDLLSVSALTKEGDDVTAIAAADYFLEPVNLGPPYSRIEIDLASTAFFSASDTHQRQIRVTGSWGYGDATKAAGTVASGLASDAAATSMVCSNASLIDVGDTLLIQSEQVFVSEREFAALGSVLINDASVTAAMNDTAITVDASHGILAGETIKLDSEMMYVSSVSGNVLTVIRAYDGTVLAAHADDTAVNINRTLTIVRAENGTTAAVHANATAVTKYAPPLDISELCKALAIHDGKAEQGGWTGIVGSGEGAIRVSQSSLNRLRDGVRKRYQRHLIGAV